LSQNEGIDFSDRHIYMSELLTLDDQRFNGGKRDLGKFIDNAVTFLSLKIRVIQYVLLNFVKLI